MNRVIDSLEQRQLRSDLPPFKAGDSVRVHFQVIEGQRRRVQVFEGIVIKRQGAGVRETFTVRKQSFGVGVERTFPLHSPKIERIEVTAIGDVNRAKLYYLRGNVDEAVVWVGSIRARPLPGQTGAYRAVVPVEENRSFSAFASASFDAPDGATWEGQSDYRTLDPDESGGVEYSVVLHPPEPAEEPEAAVEEPAAEPEAEPVPE